MIRPRPHLLAHRPPASRTGFVVTLVSLVILVAGPLAAQEPTGAKRAGTTARPYAAFVTDLDGSVRSVESNAAIRIFAGLRAGEHLRLDAGARVEIAVPGSEGYVAELRGPGAFAFDGRHFEPVPGSGALPPLIRTLSPALRSLRLDPTAVVRAGISLRADPRPDAGERPRPLGAELPEDVTGICWPAPGDADHPDAPRRTASWWYEIQVYDESGTALLSVRTRDRCVAWTRPERLLPGRAFSGTVLAGHGQGRERVLDIAFRIVDADEAARMRVALAQVAQDGPRAERMVLALALAQAGLVDRARMLWPGTAGAQGLPGQELRPRWREP